MVTLFPGSSSQGDLGHSNQHRTLMGNLCCRVAHWSGQGLVRSSSQSAALPAQSCSGPLCLTGIIISMPPPNKPCTLHLSLCSQEDPADMLDDLKSHGDAPFPCTNLTLQSVTVLLLRQRVLVLRVMNPQRDSVHGGYSLSGWSLFSR